MNNEAIKHIYRSILKYNATIKWHGNDRYQLTWHYSNKNKYYEVEYQNGQWHGKHTSWYENGNKRWETEYQNGQFHGKHISWYENGNKSYETEYQNGKFVK